MAPSGKTKAEKTEAFGPGGLNAPKQRFQTYDMTLHALRTLRTYVTRSSTLTDVHIRTYVAKINLARLAKQPDGTAALEVVQPWRGLRMFNYVRMYDTTLLQLHII